MIIVYTKNDCSQCKKAKAYLESIKVTNYEERNVSNSSEFMVEAIVAGYSVMPVVIRDGAVVAIGYKPETLDALECKTCTDKENEKTILAEDSAFKIQVIHNWLRVEAYDRDGDPDRISLQIDCCPTCGRELREPE